MSLCSWRRASNDETWLYHLKRGDYSRWFRDTIKDEPLAQETMGGENYDGLPASDSRLKIKKPIETRYSTAA